MKLLLTNDDGISAKGLQTLARELEKEYDLTIVAPDNERSATSHAITISKPLLVKREKLSGIKSKAYSVSGTPADCVRVALDKLVEGKVDMVLSGINMGLNLGMDVLYSGTVSAAIEANIYNIPSIAVSAEDKDGKACYEIAAKYTKDVLEKAKKNFISANTVFNINTPCIDEEKIKGMKVCKIGEVIYDYYIVDKDSTEDELTLKIKGREDKQFKEGTDRYYLSKGYVTVTPLHYDLTNFELINKVKEWF